MTRGGPGPVRRRRRPHPPTRRFGGRGRRRRGTSVVEALVALLLGLFLVCLSLTVVARQRAALASIAHTGDVLATVRVARQVLGTEGRDGDPMRDGWAVSRDSMALRAFRGSGYVCGPGPTPSDLVVGVDGVRLPQPTKDSVLVLDGAGRWTTLALEDVSPASLCATDPGTRGELWHLSRPPPRDAILVRYFERGSYHVEDRALRYRRGLSGRQPLTPGVVVTPGSSFLRSSTGYALVLKVNGSPFPWRIFLPAPLGRGAAGG